MVMPDSGATARIAGRHSRSMNVLTRVSMAAMSSPGIDRISNPKRHDTGTMFDAVPPWMVVTCKVG